MVAKNLIYKTEVIVSIKGKNYSGIIELRNDKCLVYNDTRLIDEFSFDIASTDIISGKELLSFLDLYQKEKEYVQLICEGNASIKYYLKNNRIIQFVGSFERKKAEVRNYKLVLKALEYGYTGKDSGNSSIYISKSNEDVVKPRTIEQLNRWEDLLTPLPWRDYYWSLPDVGKKIYDAILDGIVNFKSTITVDNIKSKLTNPVVGIIYHYILWDNPAIFCIGEYAMWQAVDEDGVRIKITSLCGSKQSEQKLRDDVLSEVRSILNHSELYRWNDIQKEKYIHDYIIKNWPYDETKGNDGSRLEPYTVYGALVQKTAVCEGFAKAVKLLLDILGVHTQVISGTVLSVNEGHAWNAVKISGIPYHLDVTFDLGKTGGPQYAIRYDYFNVSDQDMSDRKWQDENVVWICSSREHSYGKIVGGIISDTDMLNKYLYKEIRRRKAYLYIRFTDALSGKSNDWIYQQIRLICQQCQPKAKVTPMPTDIEGLRVFALHY
mgnify:FL=1